MRSMNATVKASCAVALVVALGSVQPRAQSVPAASTGPSGVPQEGIKVHGDWTLTVRHPDGTIAGHHEFKNALSTGGLGDKLLASLLLGETVSSQWHIAFGLQQSGGCGVGPSCFITEPTHLGGGGHSVDLTKSLATAGPDVGKFVLRGSVRMVSATTITLVTTGLRTCPPSTPIVPCVGGLAAEFTRRFLTPGVPVAADQLVEVKVVISFS
jgi:hypothetical protein